MNRQLKGFAAMNTIAENLRGRTAATREVEFAVNNSKENKTMFGIKRVAIGDGERGLLYKNRRFKRVLAPGVYRLWDAFGALEIRSFDITRPDFIVVSAKTLDELLGDKASLDGDIFAYVRGRVGELGIEVLGVGIKDVILPGEMKEILNSVVQAEKAAQAKLNTSFLIEFEDELVHRKIGPARRILAAHRRQTAAISIITLGEFAEGFTDPRAMVEFLAPFRVVALSRAIAWRTAALQSSLPRRLAENDAWIAASALSYDATLIGRERAFERVPRLNYLSF